jgi:Ca2+-binding RTX toxin-like protein
MPIINCMRVLGTVSVGLLAGALAMGASVPASVSADVPGCVPTQWDEASGTLTTQIEATDQPPKIVPVEDSGQWAIGCGWYPRPKRVVITSAKALDVDLTDVVLDMLRDGNDEVKVEVDLRPAKHSPRIQIDMYWGAGRTAARTIRLGTDGVDLNGDGDTDLIIRAPSIKQLSIETGVAADDLQLRASDTELDFQVISIKSSGPAGDNVLIDAPGSSVGFQSPHGSGADRVVLAGGGAGFSGGGGNDYLDARRVTGGLGISYYSGGPGNDRIFGGPGRDFIIEESRSLGNDLYVTGAGDDRIWTYAGTDTVRSGAGRDQVLVSPQARKRMTVDTGPGNDKLAVYITRTGGRVIAKLGTGRDFAHVFGPYWRKSSIDCGPGYDKHQARGHSTQRRCEHRYS